MLLTNGASNQLTAPGLRVFSSLLYSRPMSPRSFTMTTDRPVSPPSRPHMASHFGFGGEIGTTSQLADSRPFSPHRRGSFAQHRDGLFTSAHPFLKPSQRHHGNVLDEDVLKVQRPHSVNSLPPRASRAPKVRPIDTSTDLRVVSWPGTALVKAKKAHWKPEVESKNEVKGELPPTAQLLKFPGSRPRFPTCAFAAPRPLSLLFSLRAADRSPRALFLFLCTHRRSREDGLLVIDVRCRAVRLVCGVCGSSICDV